jgi:thiamine-phosphate pyrophosphorylase
MPEVGSALLDWPTVARRAIDLSLYLVTDEALARGRSLERIVEEAIAGGVTAVQLREKTAGTAALVARGERLRAITAAASVALIVNDRVDLALAIDADGAHVGQRDLPASRAREVLGDERVLGVTVGNVTEARAARQAGADYLGSTAVFATRTKADAGEPIGIARLAALVRASGLPVVAIGGIDAHNARAVLETGVAGIAVVSAIVAADDPRGAASRLSEAVRRVRRAMGSHA